MADVFSRCCAIAAQCTTVSLPESSNDCFVSGCFALFVRRAFGFAVAEKDLRERLKEPSLEDPGI